MQKRHNGCLIIMPLWPRPGSAGILPCKDKDANSAKINAYLAKAEAIEKNAELYAVENMSATQQMLVDPQSRYMTNGKDAADALQKGMQADPNNPRLYYLQGMSLFGTPPQFGGGKDKAKPLFEKSIALYKAAQPKPLYPHWGQDQAVCHAGAVSIIYKLVVRTKVFLCGPLRFTILTA